jgi:hypothetical protein
MDVLVRKADAHARTNLRAAHFFADPPLTELLQLVFFFRSHFNATDLAVEK